VCRPQMTQIFGVDWLETRRLSARRPSASGFFFLHLMLSAASDCN
jgi:hypothetical protein